MISFQEQKEQQNRGEKEKEPEKAHEVEGEKPTAEVPPFTHLPSTPSRCVARVRRTLSFRGIRPYPARSAGRVRIRVVPQDEDYTDNEDTEEIWRDHGEPEFDFI